MICFYLFARFEQAAFRFGVAVWELSFFKKVLHEIQVVLEPCYIERKQR